MQNKFLIIILSIVFIMASAADAEAQSRNKKKKGKQRTEKTEQVDEDESNGVSQRSSRVNDSEDGPFFTTEKLAYDLLGNFGFFRIGASASTIKFGLKPAISYKVLPRISFGIAPKIEYYFTNILDQEDLSEFDLGIEFFGRVLILESIYLQVGYDVNNYIYYLAERDWKSSPVIGGGYMSGFGDWRYGAQILFLLNEERRDYDNSPIELWFGFTYNL